ncbi:unnamed protein product [Schistosoma turkestanicum]|nr:unnamed protein product [Schistosoma turkestanicum]
MVERMNPSGHIVVIRRDGTDGLTCDWCSPLCDIGSNPSCDIRVKHSTVAPFHCTLQLMRNGLVQAVSRADGQYKMLVNDSPLKDACVLSDNSVLTVGDRQFRFFYPSIQKAMTDDLLCEMSSKQPSSPKNEEAFTPNSLPIVHPSKRSTSKKILSNRAIRPPRQRSTTPKRTLGTSERYGPVPPRQPSTPPVIQVLRHELNSSQSKHLPLFQAGNDECRKQNLDNRMADSFTDINVSKPNNHQKSLVISDFTNSTSHTSSGILSSVKSRPHNHIETPVITSTLTNDRLSLTPNENRRSPGFRKSFHKLLILNASNKSNLYKVDQCYDESDCEMRRKIGGKKSSNGQVNESFYDNHTNNPTEKDPNGCVPDLVVSPNSVKVAKKSLSINSLEGISSAYSPETEKEFNYHSSKRIISEKTYPAAEDMIAPIRRRGVSFGPPLSPEQFHKSLPPSTPVKRGETPLTKLSHSTPANQSFQVTPVVGRSATPFASKARLSQVTQLSAFFETTPQSPNYNLTNNRVSAVISLPPTPDTNLLNSLSTDTTYAPASFTTCPVTSAAYSAPIKTYPANRKNLKRHSLGFPVKISKTLSPKVPPTSPATTNRNEGNPKKDCSEKYHNELPDSFDQSKSDLEKTNFSLPHLITSKTKRNNNPSRSKSLPPTEFAKKESANPKESLLSPTKNAGLTGVKRLMRTPKSVRTPRVSGVSELFVEEESVKRRRGRPSSVPPTDLAEEEPVTPEQSSLSPTKNAGLTGVKRLMRTPKSVRTPRVSGVSELFAEEESVKRRRGRPSSVPPTDLAEEEPVTPEQSSLSPTKNAGLTGVKRLMRTPKSVRTPRVSGVSALFVEEESVKRRRGRPSSVPPTDLAEEEPVTPEQSSLSPTKNAGLTGVKRLMRTPKSVRTPRVSGVSELFAEEESVKRRRGRPSSVPPTNVAEEEPVTPEQSLLSSTKNAGLTGVKRLMRTPKSVRTPRVSGVSELFVEEESVKRRRGRPSSVPPTDLAEEEPVTPEQSLLSPTKNAGLTGVKRLMRTPKSVRTPRVSGVSELFVEEESVKRRRGRPSSVPPTNLAEEEPVTPEQSSLSPTKNAGLTGVKRLMRTPKSVRTPRVSGVSELFAEEESVKRRRGRPSSVPPTNLAEEEPVTPEQSSLSPTKNAGLTGVKRLMRTPKSVRTPRVSGVSELFVEEESVKRRRGRPSSVPPTDLAEEEPVTPEQSSLSPTKNAGLTGVKRLMRTPKSVRTPRVSGVSELFVEEESVKRRRGRPSSVPPTNLAEEEPVTPEQSSLSPTKNAGLTGVKRLMRTPKSVRTPRVSGVSELFVEEESVKRRRGRPSSVPPTDLAEEEPVTPEQSSLSPTKNAGLTGVKRLMRTPKSVRTPRVSGVSELFVEEEGVKGRRGRPSPVAPTDLAEEETVTPEQSSLSPTKNAGLTGVKRLMRTPKSVRTPRVSGVSELFVEEESVKRRRGRPSSVPPTDLAEEEPVTPEQSSLSPTKNAGLTGVKRLMRTPKSVRTPRVSGVSELFVEEESVKRRRGRPSSVPPTDLAEEEPVTPEQSSLSPTKNAGLTGVKRLMRTPKSVRTPRVSGVSELFVEEESVKRRRGRPSSVPPTNLAEEEPVTPEQSLLSPTKNAGLTGVKRLMRTPKSVRTPRVSGVSELFVEEESVKRRRGRPSSVPPTDLAEEEPVTPEQSLLSPTKNAGLTGVKRLMRTPKSVRTPRVSGVSELFVEEESVKRRRGRPSSVPPTNLAEEEPVTPEQSLLSSTKNAGLTGVKRLMRTPKSVRTPRVSGVSELFAEEESVKRRRGRPSSVPPTDLAEEEPVTPEQSSLSPTKNAGLTGVKRLMRTPKSVRTPRVSGVSELFVEEESVKRRRGRPSSVPPTNLAEEEPVTPEQSLLSPTKNAGLTGVKRLMRTPKSVRTPRVSGVSELFVEEESVKRRRGRPSSVPSTNLAEEEPVTPELSSLSSTKNAVVTGVRMLRRNRRALQSVNYFDGQKTTKTNNLSTKTTVSSSASVVVPRPVKSPRRRTGNKSKKELVHATMDDSQHSQGAVPPLSEIDNIAPVAKRLRNRTAQLNVACLSSGCTQRPVKIPGTLVSDSIAIEGSDRSDLVKTSSETVVPKSNVETTIKQSKSRTTTRNRNVSEYSKCPDPLQDHSLHTVKSSNSSTSKRSAKRLSVVRRDSLSIPIAKRLRNRSVRSDIDCVTNEQTQDEVKSLPVKNRSGEKKNVTKTNNPRNRKQVVISQTSPLPTSSSSKSTLIDQSSDDVLSKTKIHTRHTKRPSVIPVDSIAKVSPKRRALRSHKLTTTTSEITSQPPQKSISSKITKKPKLTKTNNNNNSSVASKSRQVKQSPSLYRQTRSKTQQTSNAKK